MAAEYSVSIEQHFADLKKRTERENQNAQKTQLAIADYTYSNEEEKKYLVLGLIGEGLKQGLSIPQAIAGVIQLQAATLQREIAKLNPSYLTSVIGEFYTLPSGLLLVSSEIDPEANKTRKDNTTESGVEVELIALAAEKKANEYAGDKADHNSLGNQISRLLDEEPLGVKALGVIGEAILLKAKSEDSEVLPKTLEYMINLGIISYMIILNDLYERHPQLFNNASRETLRGVQTMVRTQRKLYKTLK